MAPRLSTPDAPLACPGYGLIMTTMTFSCRYVPLIFALACTMSGCSSHRYAKEAEVVADAVTEVLIRLGQCASVQTCQRAKMVFWEGGGWQFGPWQGGGVRINVYRVSDVTVANALLARCRTFHELHPTVPLSIVVHATAHIDNVHPGTPVIVTQARFA